MTILKAFKSDCQSRNLNWASIESQLWAIRLFIRHPLVKQYPPHPQVLQSFLKRYIRDVEEQYMEAKRKKEHSELNSSSRNDDMELLHPDLLSAHFNSFSSDETKQPRMCYKSFVNYYTPMRNCQCYTSLRSRNKSNPFSADSHLLLTELLPTTTDITLPFGDCEKATEGASSLSCSTPLNVEWSPSVGSSYPCTTTPAPSWATETLSYSWNTLSVAHNVFQNVGLSLWPAAFALVQLLSQEFSGESCAIETIKAGTAVHKRLSIIELGAGVGLTPCILAGQQGFQEKALRFCSTDYQIELIENMRKNFWINGIDEEPQEKEGHESLQFLHQAEVTDGCEDRRAEVVEGAVVQDVKGGVRREKAPCVEKKDGNKHHPSVIQMEKRKGEEMGTSSALPNPPVKFSLALLDWNELPTCRSLFSSHGCDLILGADCIYDASVIPALVTVIHAGLTLSTSSSLESIPPCAIIVQTHRQAKTMKVFFDAVRAHDLHVKSYRAQLLPLEEALELLQFSSSMSGSAMKCIPLGKWAQHHSPTSMKDGASGSSSSFKVCMLIPGEVQEDGHLRYVEGYCRKKDGTPVKNSKLSEENIEDGWIGLYYVSMVDLLGVHIISS